MVAGCCYLWLLLVVVVGWCCLFVFERAHNIAQPTQELGSNYVDGLSMSANVG